MKYYKYEFNLVLLNIVSVIIFVFMVLITFLITRDITFLDFKMIEIIYIILWMILHELLHGVGFISCGEAKLKNIYIGAAVEKGIFYCMCKKDISKKNILVSLMFPFVIIGLITYALGLIFSSNILILLSIFNISGASGDLLMFFDILRMPKNIKYLDLDDIAGYTLITKDDITDVRTYSAFLCESGKYTSKIKGTNTKRINITKLSAIFIIVCVLLSIISLF